MNEQAALRGLPAIAGHVSRVAATIACLMVGAVVLILNT